MHCRLVHEIILTVIVPELPQTEKITNEQSYIETHEKVLPL